MIYFFFILASFDIFINTLSISLTSASSSFGSYNYKNNKPYILPEKISILSTKRDPTLTVKSSAPQDHFSESLNSYTSGTINAKSLDSLFATSNEELYKIIQVDRRVFISVLDRINFDEFNEINKKKFENILNVADYKHMYFSTEGYEVMIERLTKLSGVGLANAFKGLINHAYKNNGALLYALNNIRLFEEINDEELLLDYNVIVQALRYLSAWTMTALENETINMLRPL